MTAVVALASGDPRVRKELAAYLEAAGFRVEQFDQPPRAQPGWSLVWLAERDVHARVVETVATTWLTAPHTWRVVVVTWRPVVLKALADAHGTRLAVLAPPVFGWQVVDPLRGGDGDPEAA
jgi:hypothetical protein